MLQLLAAPEPTNTAGVAVSVTQGVPCSVTLAFPPFLTAPCLPPCARSHYFAGRELQGCGSPHTPHNYVWSLAHCVQGLTTTSIEEKVKLFR